MLKNQQKMMLAGLLAICSGVPVMFFAVFGGHHAVVSVILGFWGIVMILSSAVFIHISQSTCSDLTSLHGLVLKFIVVKSIVERKSRHHCKSFESSTTDCAGSQKDFLIKQIRKCTDTVYGKDFDFKDVTSVEDFVQKHPVTTYEHYGKYIERVAKGEVGVMSHRKPLCLGMTSGTTGNAKLLPVSSDYVAYLAESATAVATFLQAKSGFGVPGPLQLSCFLLTAVPISKSEAGLPVGPITTFMLPDPVIKLIFSTPVVGYHILDERASMYIHALFALRDENLGYIFAPFVSSLYIFFRLLEATWETLVRDIRHGIMSADLPALSVKDLNEINAHLYPMPRRADELEKQFKMGFTNIVTRLWPKMPSLIGTTSGSMQTYAKLLETYIGDLKILSRYYISTEGLLGYAIGFPEDGQTEYVCIPNGLFYEFIPVAQCNDSNPSTVSLEDVRVGESYEVVVTNSDGLYRYRMGDVILITRFYNKAPVFQFQYRRGELLNLCSEKTSEVMISTALKDTVKLWKGVDIVQYACAESPLYEEATGDRKATNLLYYVIFIELTKPEEKAKRNFVTTAIKRFEHQFDANLRGSGDSYYSKMRDAGKLQSPRVIFVDDDAFNSLRTLILDTSSVSPGQIKLPRKLRKLDWIRLILQHEVKMDAF